MPLSLSGSSATQSTLPRTKAVGFVGVRSSPARPSPSARRQMHEPSERDVVLALRATERRAQALPVARPAVAVEGPRRFKPRSIARQHLIARKSLRPAWEFVGEAEAQPEDESFVVHH